MLARGALPDDPVRFHLGSGITAYHEHYVVAGDWNGDGRDTLGVYDPRSSSFQIRSHNAAGDPDIVVTVGNRASVGLAGDWDGDGDDGIGLFDTDRNRFTLFNEIGSAKPDHTFPFGEGAVWPVSGDWNGDGVDTIGVVNKVTGILHLRNLNAAGPPSVVVEPR